MDPHDILEYEPGSFVLSFSDLEEHSAYIQDEGGHGGGYSWEAIVKAALQLRSLAVPDVEFDPESDMFSAASSNRTSLEKIASLIDELRADRAFMAKALAHAKKGGYFE